MKNLTIWIKQLVVVSLFLLTSIANASLISMDANDSWSVTEPNPYIGKEYYSIVSLGDEALGSYGAISFMDIDLTNLSSFSFSMVFIPTENSIFSVSLESETQKQQLINLSLDDGTLGTRSLRELSNWYHENYTFTPSDLSIFNKNNEVNLTFKFFANARISQEGSGVYFKNINLVSAHAESASVPEPSTIILMLLALIFICRKQLFQSFTANQKQ